MTSCLICGEIAGDPSADLLADLLGGPYQRRVLMEGSRFAVLPSVGPLSVGHVLICPRRHINRFAALSVEDTVELETLRSALETRIRASVGEAFFHYFEHGGDAAATRTPCTVDHAHLHVVPTSRIESALPDMGTWRQVAGLEEAMVVVGSAEYVYYEEPSSAAWVWEATAAETIPSQLMRRALAGPLGIESEWNWRDAPRLGVLADTVRALAVGGAATVIANGESNARGVTAGERIS